MVKFKNLLSFEVGKIQTIYFHLSWDLLSNLSFFKTQTSLKLKTVNTPLVNLLTNQFTSGECISMSDKLSFTIISTIKINQDVINIDAKAFLTQ